VPELLRFETIYTADDELLPPIVVDPKPSAPGKADKAYSEELSNMSIIAIIIDLI